jgi:hypothetical protein
MKLRGYPSPPERACTESAQAVVPSITMIWVGEGSIVFVVETDEMCNTCHENTEMRF